MAYYQFHLLNGEVVHIKPEWRPLNDHLDRAHRPCGYFIDREQARMCRTNGYHYEVFRAGGSPTGHAMYVCGDDSIANAFAKLDRARATRD
jgi:hypothetical protein